MQINTILRDFKTDRGDVNYLAVLSIPKNHRIPELAKNDFVGVAGLITAGITLAIESMNLKRSMNANQILDLAEAIIDSSTEDNLSMEDLMLFMQKLVRGEYGAMYESMDIPKFMTAFEEYRQERHIALVTSRENQHIETKGLGDCTRSVKKDEMDEHFYNMTGRIQDMKIALQETRKENTKLKNIDKF